MDKIISVMPEQKKPCPCCGSERITISYITPVENVRLWNVQCDGCGINTGYTAIGREAALEKWSRRVIEPEEYERLKRCNHECKIDCLLKEYDRVKEERDEALSDKQFLLDGIRNLLNSI